MQRISPPRADILPAILIAAVPLAFLAAISLYQIFGNASAAQAVHEKILNSFFVVRTASDLCGEIQSAERGQRGYLITGRDDYLAPYEKAKKRIPQLLSDLQQATLDRPDQQRRLLQLQADLTTKLNELASTIMLRREQSFDAALATVNSDVGQKAMDAIEADTTEILDAAHARLQQRLDAAEALDQNVALAFVVGSAIAAVALILSGLLLAGAYRRAATSKRMLQATLESVREGIVAVDAERRVVAWNQTFKRMLKLPKGTMRFGETLKAHHNPEIDKFGSHFDALDLEIQRTGRPALVERGRRKIN